MVDSREQALDAVSHAWADPTRRAILRMLAERPYALGELGPAFPISAVAVSKHVRTLEAAGLVARQVQGRSYPYTVGGWFGGFFPAIAFSAFTATGNL